MASILGALRAAVRIVKRKERERKRKERAAKRAQKLAERDKRRAEQQNKRMKKRAETLKHREKRFKKGRMTGYERRRAATDAMWLQVEAERRGIKPNPNREAFDQSARDASSGVQKARRIQAEIDARRDAQTRANIRVSSAGENVGPFAGNGARDADFQAHGYKSEADYKTTTFWRMTSKYTQGTRGGVEREQAIVKGLNEDYDAGVSNFTEAVEWVSQTDEFKNAVNNPIWLDETDTEADAFQDAEHEEASGSPDRAMYERL